MPSNNLLSAKVGGCAEGIHGFCVRFLSPRSVSVLGRIHEGDHLEMFLTKDSEGQNRTTIHHGREREKHRQCLFSHYCFFELHPLPQHDPHGVPVA